MCPPPVSVLEALWWCPCPLWRVVPPRPPVVVVPRASIYTVRPVLIRNWKPGTAHLTPEPPALIGGREYKTHSGAVANLTPSTGGRQAVFIFVPFGGGQS